MRTIIICIEQFFIRHFNLIYCLVDLMGTTPLTDTFVWIVIAVCWVILFRGENKERRSLLS